MHIQTAEQMKALGAQLAQALQTLQSNQSTVININLQGNLGAGKTTLTQGLVQALLPDARVKSPTYTLVETYEVGDFQIAHFDLYRLCDPEELEFLGIRDYFEGARANLIEWAEKGEGVLPEFDVKIDILIQGETREVRIEAMTETGEELIHAMG